MRKVADYSFMLQDYKFALATYESLKKEFSTNSSQLHRYLAGVQEMIGLCGLLCDPTKGSFEPFVEQAVALYKDQNMPPFAERCVLMFTELMTSRGLYLEAAIAFIKAAGDVPLFLL